MQPKNADRLLAFIVAGIFITLWITLWAVAYFIFDAESATAFIFASLTVIISIGVLSALLWRTQP